jgi:hypothetical protein
VPAWGKIEQYAKDTWGDGGWNIVTNPSEVSTALDLPPIVHLADGDLL